MKDNIELSDTPNNVIFEKIKKKYLFNINSSINPKGVILGGQPGSGKSFLQKLIAKEFIEDFIFISTDDLRSYHPAYLELQQNPETVENAANLVNPYASAWTEKLIKYCIANKYSLIIDSTLAGNISAVYETIELFRNNAYEVHLKVMAVPAIISKLSIFLRYETQLTEKGFARWTRMEDHDDRYDKLEENLTQILLHKTPDSLAFYTREYTAHGTSGLRQLKYIDCRKASSKVEYLKYEYWQEFETYRDSGLLTVETIKYLINTVNIVINLIQKREGDTLEFENYIKIDLFFLKEPSLQQEIKALDSSILRILFTENISYNLDA